jgi:hypothetical protein
MTYYYTYILELGNFCAEDKLTDGLALKLVAV